MRGLQDYRVLRVLGAGGEGQSFLAMDLRLMRRVVVKVRSLDDSRSARRRFHAEARRVAQLEGQRVVQVFDAVSSGGDAALVLRYVPGCNLDELLRSTGTLSPANVLSIVTDLAEGLAAARQQLLVHGDIKGANVLLGRDGRAALTDFGIAVGSGRQSRGASPLALTPEHLSGSPLTQQSDFFALGLLACRMLTGRHPFAFGDRVDEERLAAGLCEPLRLPSSLGPAAARAFETLLHSLLQARPEDRPPSTLRLRNALREVRATLPPARGLQGAVAAVLRDEAVDAAAPPLPRRLRRPPRAERWWASCRDGWRRASPGARVSAVASVVLVAWLGLLFAQRPGLCVLLQPSKVDLSPLAAAQLPDAARLEERLLYNLRRWPEPLLVIGAVAGSDTKLVLRPQGVRDVCNAERALQLSLRCWGEECQLGLEASAPDLRRRVELVLPSHADLRQLQQSIDQLLAPQLPALLRR